jgi:AraC-like DNA-binding protein
MPDVARAASERLSVLAADPEGDKQRRWQSAIFETFGAMEVGIRDDLHFSGAIRRVPVADMELTDVRSTSECARRTRRHLTSDRQEAVALLLIRHGNVQMDQYCRRTILGAGTFTLLDLNEPYAWIHPHAAHVIGIKVVRSALAQRIGDLTPYVGCMRGTATGIGRLTADFLESFASQANSIDKSAGPTLVRQFLDLTALLLTGKETLKPLSTMTPAEAIYWRALAFIDRHLSDVDLAPEDIAQAMPVSLRYLHVIFQSSGTSVCETILNRRLAYCHSRLAADPQLRVSQTAYHAGFRSHAHFSTAFKEKYGCSPRDIRRQRSLEQQPS